MSEEINVNNFIAIGNGENCPYCIGDSVFVASEENDIVQHIMDSLQIMWWFRFIIKE